MSMPWTGLFYTVAIYNKALTESEIARNYSVGPCDSLNTAGIDYKLNIYPNPVSDFAQIEITPVEDADIVSPTVIRIMNTNGQVCHQESLFNPYEQVSRTIDFRSYSKGIYFLQVISGLYIKTAKLVVQ
jgi:hypothetical protein